MLLHSLVGSNVCVHLLLVQTAISTLFIPSNVVKKMVGCLLTSLQKPKEEDNIRLCSDCFDRPILAVDTHRYASWVYGLVHVHGCNKYSNSVREVVMNIFHACVLRQFTTHRWKCWLSVQSVHIASINTECILSQTGLKNLLFIDVRLT